VWVNCLWVDGLLRDCFAQHRQLTADAALAALPIARFSSVELIVLCAVVALVSHLVITSRTVRATVLIPACAIPFAANGASVSMMIFVAVIACGFCQTFTVSAKPVAIYAQLDTPTFSKNDLLTLSAALALPMLALIVTFAVFVWPHFGL
jgi:solute carrier family 13 (sodium-dependent dicarboxylate transporter), member 2/3/5